MEQIEDAIVDVSVSRTVDPGMEHLYNQVPVVIPEWT